MFNISLTEFVKNSKKYQAVQHVVDHIPVDEYRATLKEALKKAELFDLVFSDRNARSELSEVGVVVYPFFGMPGAPMGQQPLIDSRVGKLIEEEIIAVKKKVYAHYEDLRKRYTHDLITFNVTLAGDCTVTVSADMREAVVYLNVYEGEKRRYRKYYSWLPWELTADLVEFAREVAKEWQSKTPDELQAMFAAHDANPNKVRNASFSGSSNRSDERTTHLILTVDEEYRFGAPQEQPASAGQ